MKQCEDCIHDEVCNMWAVDSGIPFVNADTCVHYKAKSDVVELPCKVGDTVWFETFKNNGSDCVGIQPHTIDRVDIDFVVGAKKLIETKIPDFRIGKYVFLTREEAEQALKDMQRGDKDGE